MICVNWNWTFICCLAAITALIRKEGVALVLSKCQILHAVCPIKLFFLPVLSEGVWALLLQKRPSTFSSTINQAFIIDNFKKVELHSGSNRRNNLETKNFIQFFSANLSYKIDVSIWSLICQVQSIMNHALYNSRSDSPSWNWILSMFNVL